MSYFRSQLESWLKTIDIEAQKVLDIGGGTNPVNTRVGKWRIGEFKTLDNKAEEPTTSLNYVNDLNQLWCCAFLKMLLEEFDVVFCLEVMEYVWNPVTAFENFNNVLKKGGLLYISFPWIYPLHNPPGIDCLRYSENAIKKLAEESNFRILELKKRTMTYDSIYKEFVRAEGMHPIEDNAIGYLCKMQKI